MEEFQIYDISGKSPAKEEQAGTNYKFWFYNEGIPHLFITGRKNTGDDWSEKIACGLCGLLGILHAHYELGIYKGGKHGVISKTFVPTRGRLCLGSELLTIKGYQPNLFYGAKGHTLNRVARILMNPAIGAPLDCVKLPGVETAFDFFVGYLMLDAWIANQGRHHDNWGILVRYPTDLHLAPSYDHASCLGSGETNENRDEMLRTLDKARSIERYVKRARSSFYESPKESKPMLTLDAFKNAAMKSPKAGLAWLGKLDQVSFDNVQSMFDKIPRMIITEYEIEFATRLLEINRQRLYELVGEL